MAGPYNARIRKGEPYELRVLSWTAPDNSVVDPALYTWSLRTADDELTITGVVATGIVSFLQTSAQTAALKFTEIRYAVIATPISGGEPTRVLAGRLNADRDPLT